MVSVARLVLSHRAPRHRHSTSQASTRHVPRQIFESRHQLQPPSRFTTKTNNPQNTPPLREPTSTPTLGEHTSAVGLAHRYVQ